MNFKISLIVPTLGTRELEIRRLIDSLNLQTCKNFEVIFVTQDNHQNVENILKSADFEYRQVKLYKKGLSYSRNQGMEFVSGNIVTFSDDDCWYPENAFELIVKEFESSDAAALSFQIFDPESRQFYKNYRQDAVSNLDFRGILRISSIEFFINLDKVNKGNLRFDERFGLGAKYPSGEENILLADLLKKKYKISYVNKVIVFHRKKTLETNLITSSTFTGKGPLFKRMRGTIPAICMLIIFFVKKFHLTEKPIRSFIKSFKELLNF